MTMFSKTITGLINGISKQPAPMRLTSQGQEQVNCVSDTAKGVRRRAGMEHLWETAVLPQQPSPQNDAYHWIDRDVDRRFVVWIRSETAASMDDPIVRIVNVETGAVVTPTIDALEETAVLAYLRSSDGSAARALHLLSVGDLTYVANTEKVVAMDTSAKTAPAPDRSWALVIFKTGLAWVFYKLSSGATNVLRWNIQTSSQVIAPSLARHFVARIKNLAGYVLSGTGFANTDWDANLPLREASGAIPSNVPTAPNSSQRVFSLIKKGTLPQSPDLSLGDSWGDGDTQLLRDGDTVQSFSELPAQCVENIRIKVEGDPDVNVDSFYVEFQTNEGLDTYLIVKNPEPVSDYTRPHYGDGRWEECARWDINRRLDAATMPLALRRVTDSNWTLGLNTWTEREVGDEDTAPDPPFVGQTIQDLAFFKDRLAVVTGETVVFSAVGEYGSFFPSTVTTLTDDDPFDVTANFPEIAKLRFATPFFNTLVLFSDSGIFGIEGSPDGFTAKTLQFAKLTSFTGGVTSRPALAGDRIFFTEIQDGKSVVHEFLRGDAEEPFRSEPITAHISGYISSNIDEMTVDANNQTLMILAAGANRPVLWVYNWFLSGREKVQSAWHRWNIGSYYFDQSGDTGFVTEDSLRPASVRFIDGDLYVLQTWAEAVTSEDRLLMGRVATAPAPDPMLAAFDPTVIIGDGLVAPTWENRQIPYLDHWTLTDAFTAEPLAGPGGIETLLTFTNSARLVDLILSTGALGAADLEFFGVVQAQNSTNTNQFAGLQMTVNALTVLTSSSFDVRVQGTVPSGAIKPKLLVGIAMRSLYEFSPPSQKGQNNAAILGGKTMMKRMVALFEDRSTVRYYVSSSPVIDTQGVGGSAGASRGLVTGKAQALIPVHQWNDERPLGVGIYSDSAIQDFTLYGVVHEVYANIRHGARIA